MAGKKKRSRVDCSKNNTQYDVVEVVPLENRYTSLTKYSNDTINQNETCSDESNQDRQQKQAQRQTRDRSQRQVEQQDRERKQQQQPRRRRDKNPQAQKSQAGEQKRRIDIVGDSMLKGLKGHKMSRTNKVRVSTFSGCSTRNMFDYIKPTINRKPYQLILHVGTNSLRDCSSPTECAGEIIDLANSIKDSLPATELVVSALITRSYNTELAGQVGEVNEILRQHYDKKRWTILEHSNIRKRNLNRSGLHLNKEGTTHLACNLIQCIQHGNK
jgi:hypothetical protein